MFGKKREKIMSVPLSLPRGVSLHIMPGMGSHALTQHAPPKNETLDVTIPGQATKEKFAVTALTKPSATFATKKMFMVWGAVAVVVLGGAGLTLLLLPKPRASQSRTPSATLSVVVPPEETTIATPETTPSALSPIIPPETSDTNDKTSQKIAPSSLDTDHDGLTDVEEPLYGTQATNGDADDDGYFDGQEVANLYNPTGNAPIRLRDSRFVKEYSNTVFGYTILYPTPWTVRVLAAENPREVIFSANTGEFIQVLIEDNVEGLSAADWYVKQFPDTQLNERDRIALSGLEGIWTSDHATVYMTKTSDVSGRRLLYGITYNYGERTEVNFRTTFMMMLQSFHVGD